MNIAEGTEEQKNFSVHELTEWARIHQLDNDPYVKGLIKDIPNEENFSMWAERNPLEYLPYPSLKRPFESLLNWISVIRNALVFLPVAITWLALSRAISSYQDISQSSKPDFISFWETGVADGSSVELFSLFRLSNVAVIDFFLILVIVVMTLAHGVLFNRSSKEEESQRATSDREREEIAIEIEKVLSRKHWVTPESFEEAFEKALNKLADAITSIGTASGTLERSAEKVWTASQGVGGLSADLQSLSVSVDATNSNFIELATQISGELTQTISSFESSVREMSDSTKRNLESTGEQITAVRSDLIEKLTQVTATFERLAQDMNELPSVLKAKLDSLGSVISAESEKSIAVVTDFNSRVTGDFSDKATQILDNLETIQERFALGNRQMEFGVRQLTEELSGVQTLLESMQIVMADRISDAGGEDDLPG